MMPSPPLMRPATLSPDALAHLPLWALCVLVAINAAYVVMVFTALVWVLKETKK